MKYVVPLVIVVIVAVITAYAVKSLWPTVVTNTIHTVTQDSALVTVQQIRIDSLAAIISFQNIERRKLVASTANWKENTRAFYQRIIDSLEAHGDSASIPVASASKFWTSTAVVRTEWTDADGNSRLNDTTVNISGDTWMTYSFPPVNQFTSTTTLNPISVPYPMVRIETVRTESKISWEWTAIAASVAFVAGAFVVRK
jgi:hypothetical protein